ncbi:hypothetical protein BpHYR1_054592 [Brachionus plicatilis]|uniref:RNA-directed DNA polymerase from mobile element jockey-like n=1 Tax=Brachionus plicatilis TaxID=10195 RepID=A0A3M7QW13_BRAPC|nr:hypothetical protein BpHYR1_054592 [Brachionus plicatilis]
MCGEFGRLWRINFNPTKSVIIFQNWTKNDVSRDFYSNGITFQKVNSLFYLGLPIGDHSKILIYHQIKKLNPMDELLSYLNLYYNKFKCPEGSFIKQTKDVDPFTENGKVCMDALDQLYVSKITQIDNAQLYRKIEHLGDLLCKDQPMCSFDISLPIRTI